MSISNYVSGVRRRLKYGISGIRRNLTPQSEPPLAPYQPYLLCSICVRNSRGVPPPLCNSSISLSASTPSETAPTTKGPHSVPPTVPGVKETAWPCLQSWLGRLHTSASAFGPLKAAVDGLVECIDIYESTVQGRKGYAALRVELESLFKTLEVHFDGPVPPRMTTSIAGLSRMLQKEVKYARDKCDRNVAERFTEAASDVEDILNCYRRIHRLLSQISLNANLEMWKVIDMQLAETRLERMPISRAARYNSSESTGLLRGECTPHTRRNVIGGLHAWVDDPAGAKAYWLNGMAGTGKTTIAYSFCAELEEIHTLGASFFCSRSCSSCSNATLIVPTIAYQLALFSYPFRSVLCKLLGETQDLYNRDVTTQFQQMIVKILTDTYDSIPPNTVVVIDALDECANQHDVGLLLQVLLGYASQLPVKFFVSSRAEGAAYQHLVPKSELRSVFFLHEVEQSFVREDIGLYVTTELAPIKPSQDQIAQLVEQAGPLFIYAATVIRYVKRSGFDESSLDRLDRILQPSRDSDKIDMLYTTILSAVFNQPDLDECEKADMLDMLHAVVCLREPLTVDALGALLRPNKPYSIRTALKPFHSILHISESSGIVATLHASFADYLCSKKRAGEFYCDERQENYQLARACFNRIGAVSPPFNICALESSYVFDEDVPDLLERITKNIPSELFYACSYWIYHVEASGEWDTLKESVDGFLSHYLLVWMEVMNLKKSINIGAHLISRALQWCMKHVCDNSLVLLARDSYNFITTFASSPASRSTSHIYTSVLSLWPPDAPVSACYTERIHGLVQVKGVVTAGDMLPLLARWHLDGDTRADFLAISPDGSRIAIGGASTVSFRVQSYGISIWDVHSGQKMIGPLNGHTYPLSSVVYSPGGACIVSACSNTIFVWDAHFGGRILGPLKGQRDILSVTYSPNETHIISGSSDGTICGWSVSTGHVIFKFKSSNGAIRRIAFSPDGISVAVGCEKGLICIWNLRTHRIMHQLSDTSGAAVTLIAYSPDGAYIVASSDAQYIWDARTGRKLAGPLKWHTSMITQILYSPDGAHIASSSLDGTVHIREAKSGEKVAELLQGHLNRFNPFVYSPDAARIITGSTGTICVWDTLIGGRQHLSVEGHTACITSVAYSPDDSRIISGSDDKTIYVWDAHTGRRFVGPLLGHTEGVLSVAYSPDGLYIVSGSADKTLLIWDAAMGRKIIGPFEGHTDAVHTVIYLPDGTRIASGSRDQTIRVWDSATGKRTLEPFQGHDGSVTSVSCSADGAYIASCSIDNTVRLWDASTGECVRVLNEQPGHVQHVVCLPDQQHVLSATHNTLFIWNTHTGQITLEPLNGDSNSIYSLAYPLDATRIATYTFGGDLEVWDVSTRRHIVGPLPASGPVWSLALTSDGTHIASGGSDNVIRVWRLDQLSCGQKPEWELTEEGWVLDRAGQRLLWVPLDMRDELLPPGKILHISRRGSYSLNFDNACLGPSWNRVYSAALM